jgi:hypothetical protein
LDGASRAPLFDVIDSGSTSCLPFLAEGLHLLLVRVQYKDIIIYIKIILYVRINPALPACS